MLVRIVNLLWVLANLPAYICYQRDCNNPRKAQEKLLKHIVAKNAATQFGQATGFSEIHSIKDYQQRVSIQQYEDVKPWINRISTGEPNILTSETVRRFMPSSGSTTSRKLIPYTDSLQQSFDHGIAAWIVNLYFTYPALMKGRAYWSISPHINESDESIIPIGFEQDTEYLGSWKKRLVDSVMAVDPCVADIQDIATFRYVTLLQLLQCKDLCLISVWHPTYLTLLVNELPRFWESLLQDIYNGTVSPPTNFVINDIAVFNKRPNKERYRELRKVRATDFVSIWPNLKLISCWGSAHAAGPIQELTESFPGIEIQPKGLIATEAFMSLPFCQMKESKEWFHPLSIRSNFFEFMDDNKNLYLVDQLVVGKEYQIIVTTAGGLYRYSMNDRVRVNGYVGNTPSIEFIGKTDAISDFFGEKLNDQFVSAQLLQILTPIMERISFVMLAPDGECTVGHYTLYIESDSAKNLSFKEELDSLLCKNPHYRLCRELGQLRRLRVFHVKNSGNQHYLEYCKKSGKNLGDIKPVMLSSTLGWTLVFDGEYIE